LADWLPANLEYIGPVLKMTPIFIDNPAPPSPATPEYVFVKSTVQIEEVDEAAAAKALADEVILSEMRAVVAAGPGDDERDEDDDEESGEDSVKKMSERIAAKRAADHDENLRQYYQKRQRF
jgi:hypothetical protein